MFLKKPEDKAYRRHDRGHDRGYDRGYDTSEDACEYIWLTN